MIDGWSDQREVEAKLAPYIDSYVRRWPARYCQAPRHWLDALLEGEPPAGLCLVRLLLLSNRDLSDIQRCRHIADAPQLQWLTHLCLSTTRLTAAGLEILGGSEHLRRVQDLDLYNNKLHGAGIEVLCEAPAFGNLEVLSLRMTQVDASDIALLAGAPMAAGLRSLDLEQNGREAPGSHSRWCLDDRVIDELLRPGAFEALEELNLRECGLGFEAAARLLRGGALPRLRRLNLRYNDLLASEDDRLEALARERGLEAICL